MVRDLAKGGTRYCPTYIDRVRGISQNIMAPNILTKHETQIVLLNMALGLTKRGITSCRSHGTGSCRMWNQIKYSPTHCMHGPLPNMVRRLLPDCGNRSACQTWHGILLLSMAHGVLPNVAPHTYMLPNTYISSNVAPDRSCRTNGKYRSYQTRYGVSPKYYGTRSSRRTRHRILIPNVAPDILVEHIPRARAEHGWVGILPNTAPDRSCQPWHRILPPNLTPHLRLAEHIHGTRYRRQIWYHISPSILRRGIL